MDDAWQWKSFSKTINYQLLYSGLWLNKNIHPVLKGMSTWVRIEFRIKMYCINNKEESNHNIQLGIWLLRKTVYVLFKHLVNKHLNYFGGVGGRKSDKTTISTLKYRFNKLKLCLPIWIERTKRVLGEKFISNMLLNGFQQCYYIFLTIYFIYHFSEMC